MDEYLKIDDVEFAQMLDNAGKILETMSPERIADLRTLCNDELGALVSKLESDQKVFKRWKEELEKPVDYLKDNPLKKAKARFWLGQLGNFIASFIFRVPREFTPSYAYPFGSSRKFAEQAQATDDQLRSLTNAGLEETESACMGLYEIKRAIKTDDARLIVFCHSCLHIDSAYSTVNVAYVFRKLASLLYQNNVSFPVSIYRTEYKNSSLTEAVSSMVEKVKCCYSEEKGNGA